MVSTASHERGDHRRVQAHSDRTDHVDLECAQNQDQLPTARQRRMEVQNRFGGVAKGTGLGINGLDPPELANISEHGRRIQGEAREDEAASTIAQVGVIRRASGMMVMLENGTATQETPRRPPKLSTDRIHLRMTCNLLDSQLSLVVRLSSWCDRVDTEAGVGIAEGGEALGKGIVSATLARIL